MYNIIIYNKEYKKKQPRVM